MREVCYTPKITDNEDVGENSQLRKLATLYDN